MITINALPPRQHVVGRRSTDLVGYLYRAGFVLCCLFIYTLITAETANAGIPPGPYTATCSKASMKGTTLEATCTDFFGNPKKTALVDAASCKDIRNINGDLRCVISESHAGGDHATEYDIISISHDSTENGIETKIWRIDQPRVWSSTLPIEVQYRQIKYKPGDTIRLHAGGCAQTGGFGRTWKSYVYPSGDSAQALYSGTVKLPGIVGDFERLAGYIGKNLTAPKPSNPELLNDYFLNLGYQDNGPADNGYWGHDDGNNDQCKNVGPAWVEVTIISGAAAPAGVLLSPHSKPFDIVWDMDAEDFNGLPVNPRWAFQLDHKGDPPDFQKTCGSAFSSSFGWNYSVDESKLAEICTSQAPAMDTDPQGLVCPGDPLPGHINWTIASYIGTVTWEGWSGYWPYDNDFNMHLFPPDRDGLTASGDPPVNSIGLEFDGGETVEYMGSDWWRKGEEYLPVQDEQILVADDAVWASKLGGKTGLPAVAIGLIGLDAVHGGYTESHPLFAIAIRTGETSTANTVTETWSFFLRNSGDEGKCSSLTHFWDSPTGTYFIQLPWPEGATAMNPVSSDIWDWQSGGNSEVSYLEADKQWTLVQVQPPVGGGSFGVDGTFTLEYTVPGGPKKKSAVVHAAEGNGERDPEEKEDLAQKILDSATRAKFTASVNALRTLQTHPARTKFHARVKPGVAVAHHVAGAASHGKLTRTRTVPNLPKQRIDTEMAKLVRSYQKDLKIQLPPVVQPLQTIHPVQTK